MISGRSFVGDWVGDIISLGAAISAFGCCLACLVGAARLLFAMSRDLVGERGLSTLTRQGTPGRSAWLVALLMGGILALMHYAFGATTFDSFFWSGTIGTLILLVAYVLATIGASGCCSSNARWRCRCGRSSSRSLHSSCSATRSIATSWPYPAMHGDKGAENPAFWFPIVAGGWIALCIIAVVVAGRAAAQLGRSLAAEEGFMTDQSDRMVQSRS